MKIDNLESKFRNYSLLSGAFLLLNQRLDSQVVYTDVNPDTIFDAAGEGAYFDIDISGTYDYAVVNNSFTFYHVYFSSTWSRQGYFGWAINLKLIQLLENLLIINTITVDFKVFPFRIKFKFNHFG
ncbi:MAG: hypothetical protein IPI65_10240 [Bacteroidetes bacterium]|nr:hypothetical protein [Bacteroidota bacterium]